MPLDSISSIVGYTNVQWDFLRKSALVNVTVSNGVFFNSALVVASLMQMGSTDCPSGSVIDTPNADIFCTKLF